MLLNKYFLRDEEMDDSGGGRMNGFGSCFSLIAARDLVIGWLPQIECHDSTSKLLRAIFLRFFSEAHQQTREAFFVSLSLSATFNYIQVFFHFFRAASVIKRDIEIGWKNPHEMFQHQFT